MVLTLGNPILPKKIASFGADIPGLGQYLKNQTYALQYKHIPSIAVDFPKEMSPRTKEVEFQEPGKEENKVEIV